MPAGDEFFDSDDDGFEFGDEYDTSYNKPINSHPNTREEIKPKFGGGFGRPPAKDERSAPRPRHQPESRAVHREVALDDYRMAVMKGNLPMIKEYIQQGVPVDTILKSGWTALMYACNYANLEVVSYLLEKKANANYENDKYSVLMAACSVSRGSEDQILQCVSRLTDSGADVNAYDRHHMSPLMYAAREGRATVIKHLLQRGANVNKQDSRGWTALVWATSKGRVLAVRTLLDNGADRSMKCCDGQTAEDIALSQANDQLVDLLSGKTNYNKRTTTVEPKQTTNTADLSHDERYEATTPDCARQECVRYGDLELFLFGLELGSLVPLFQEQQVTFSAFLKMTDQDLQQMGVTQIGVRKKILNAIHDTHKKDWEPSSLPSVQYNKTITAAEAVAMVTNISKHTNYIGCSFAYILAQLKSHPEILQSQQDGVVLGDLCNYSDQTILNIQKLYHEVVKLRTHVTKVQAKGEYRPPDLIKSKKSRKSASVRWRLGSLVIVSGVAYLVYKRNSVLDSLQQWFNR